MNNIRIYPRGIINFKRGTDPGNNRGRDVLETRNIIDECISYGVSHMV